MNPGGDEILGRDDTSRRKVEIVTVVNVGIGVGVSDVVEPVPTLGHRRDVADAQTDAAESESVPLQFPPEFLPARIISAHSDAAHSADGAYPLRAESGAEESRRLDLDPDPENRAAVTESETRIPRQQVEILRNFFFFLTDDAPH